LYEKVHKKTFVITLVFFTNLSVFAQSEGSGEMRSEGHERYREKTEKQKQEQAEKDMNINSGQDKDVKDKEINRSPSVESSDIEKKVDERMKNRTVDEKLAGALLGTANQREVFRREIILTELSKERDAKINSDRDAAERAQKSKAEQEDHERRMSEIRGSKN
jgi:hypothetical protein